MLFNLKKGSTNLLKLKTNVVRCSVGSNNNCKKNNFSMSDNIKFCKITKPPCSSCGKKL